MRDRLNPASLIVWETYDEADYISVRECAEDFKYGSRGVDADHDRCALVLRTREHEWAHFSQYISTTYGYRRWQLYGLKAAHFMLFASEMVRAGHANSLADLKMPQRRRMAQAEDAGIPRSARSGYWTWDALDRLLSALWKKSMTVEAFSQAIDRVSSATALIPNLGPLRMESRRAWLSQIGPAEAISVELVVEGLARYCEWFGLARHFDPDEALSRWRAARGSGFTTYTHDLIIQELDVEPFHPIIVALLDTAISAMPDPFDEDNLFVYEDHHPGIRLSQAIANLKRRGVDDPTFEDAYAIALDAMGSSPDEVCTGHRRTAERALRGELPDYDQGLHQPYEGPAGPPTLFARGMSLRADHPMSVWRSRFTDPSIDEGFVLIPPLLSQPSALAHRPIDEPSIASVAQLAALAEMTSELQQSGSVSETAVLVRKMPAEWGIGNYLGTFISNYVGDSLGSMLVDAINCERREP